MWLPFFLISSTMAGIRVPLPEIRLRILTCLAFKAGARPRAFKRATERPLHPVL